MNAIFERELSQREISFVRESEDEYRLHLEPRGIIASVSLLNVRRNAERDDDPEVMRRFVESIVQAFPPSSPSWEEVAPFLLWAAEPTDIESGDTIRLEVTETVSRVLTYIDRDQTSIHWVTPAMCEQWGVTVEQAASAAYSNQDRLLDGLQLECAENEGEVLGMIPLNSPYKASVIFARTFRALVEDAIGWPVLVVIPCRDFAYVFREHSPFLGQIGRVVVQEYRNSGYPITTEVLRISDEGIEAIGQFPADG